MIEPYLYLEDLVKAKPPKRFSLNNLAPSDDKPADTTATPGAPKGSGIKYDYWGSKPGEPDPQQGWEQYTKKDGSTGWKRPRGSGKGREVTGAKKDPKAEVGKKGKAKTKVQAAEKEKPPTAAQASETQLALQFPDKKLVSSGSKKREKVSSSAAKREQAKQSGAPAKVSPKVKKEAAPLTATIGERVQAKKEPTKKKPTTEKEKIQQQAKAAIDKEKMIRDAAKKKPAETATAKAEKPKTKQEKLILQHHNEQVKNLTGNIKSHLRNNKTIKPEQKEKLKTVLEALKTHGTLDTLPQSDHKKLLTVAKQIAGEHGKSDYVVEQKKAKAAQAAKEKKAKAAQAAKEKKLKEAQAAKEKKLKEAKTEQEKKAAEKEKKLQEAKAEKEKKAAEKAAEREKKAEAAKAEREKRAEENKKARENAQWDKKIEEAKEQIRLNTEPPDTPEGVQEHQAFKKQSKDLATNIRTHLESGNVDEENREQLENTLNILEGHQELTGLPSQEQKKAQASARKLAGVHGKPPKEPKGEKEPKEQKKRPIPFGRWARAGYQAGQAAGQAATTPEAAGGAVDAPAYGVRGAAAVGQHLLHNRNIDRENVQAKKQSNKTPKKGAEVEQSAMNKSFNLYIDLNKAGQDTATQPVLTPEHAKRKHEASYQKRPVGVANEGLVMSDKDDDEEIEKKFKSKDQQKYMHAAAERGEIPKKVVEEFADKTKDYSKLPEDVDNKKKSIKKSISSGLEDTVKSTFAPSFELLKSINSGIQEEIRKFTPSSLEAEFMVEVLGNDVSAVRKGICAIKGKDRHRFNEWAADRLSKSISSLQKRIL